MIDVYCVPWSALKKAGVEHKRLYQRRHTHATKLLANNVHPKLAQDRLGTPRHGASWTCALR